MKVEGKSAIKKAPKGRSKSEIRAMLKQKIADKKKADEAKISQGAKAAANADGKVMRVDPDKSAIGLNDPSSPATKEKLKAALKSGMVNFNPKERKVLAKLLK